MKLIIRCTCMILICVLWLCLGACDSQEKESSVPDTTPAAASTPQPATTPSPSPIPTLKPTPTPAPTPTAAPTATPTATPTPEYRDITDAEYKTLFNEEITEERLAYILQYLPVGSCENGLSAIAAKNVWENFNMSEFLR